MIFMPCLRQRKTMMWQGRLTSGQVAGAAVQVGGAQAFSSCEIGGTAGEGCLISHCFGRQFHAG